MGCFLGCFRFKDKERRRGVQATSQSAKEVTTSSSHTQSRHFNVSSQDAGGSPFLEDCSEPRKAENLSRKNSSNKWNQQLVKSSEVSTAQEPKVSSNGPSPELITPAVRPGALAKLMDLSEEEENMKLNEEVNYLKSCGTLLRTPSEICKARERSPSKEVKIGDSDWHSWFPSAPTSELNWNCLPENSPQQISARFTHENQYKDDEKNIKQQTEYSGCQKHISFASAGEDEEYPVKTSPASSKLLDPSFYKSSRYDHCPTIEEDNESSDAGSTTFHDSVTKNKPSLKQCDSPDGFDPKTPPLFKSHYSPKPTPLILTEDMQTPWTRTMGNAGVNKNARIRAQYVHPVLNPVENISQWKELKKGNLKDYEQKSMSWLERSDMPENQSVCFQIPGSKETGIDTGIPKNPNSHSISRADSVSKENFPREEEMKVKLDGADIADESLHKRKLINTSLEIYKTPKLAGESRQLPEGTPSPEMQVDSSLAHWLKTPPVEHDKISSSRTNIDDKPILGAMPVKNSQSISPAKSPSSKSSGDYDRPILGLVAAHWKDEECAHIKWWDGKGIPNSTNKYKEDQKVSWHSTPFEERLEKALSSEGVGGRELFAAKPTMSEETVQSGSITS
ncbi:hypothetical protein SUGI_1138070 [Cryptomeria japonica]|uniref:protein JASON n=1 Tax=Cryptomeria japonica TaxID=3369 RepID=UPI00241477DA|nr:protein JASON [Cryptomeria japonica]GLJ53372.1 hypothetical protein SUGI_1138070 [Cryptomeria japonica]